MISSCHSSCFHKTEIAYGLALKNAMFRLIATLDAQISYSVSNQHISQLRSSRTSTCNLNLQTRRNRSTRRQTDICSERERERERKKARKREIERAFYLYYTNNYCNLEEKERDVGTTCVCVFTSSGDRRLMNEGYCYGKFGER